LESHLDMGGNTSSAYQSYHSPHGECNFLNLHHCYACGGHECGWSAGHIATFWGLDDVYGHATTMKTLIHLEAIKPWDCRALIEEHLQKQAELAPRTPLRKVDVQDAFAYLKANSRSVVKGFESRLHKRKFVRLCEELLERKNVPYDMADKEDIGEIFDSLDYDRSGYLSTGEWASGLAGFLRGHRDQKVLAVIRALDVDNAQKLTRRQVEEFIAPFVKAMTPPEAESLRPLLVKKVVKDIFTEMDLNRKGDISAEEWLQWSRLSHRNNILTRLTKIIEEEVYKIWLEHSKSFEPHRWNSWQHNYDPYNKDRPTRALGQPPPGFGTPFANNGSTQGAGSTLAPGVAASQSWGFDPFASNVNTSPPTSPQRRTGSTGFFTDHDPFGSGTSPPAPPAAPSRGFY